MSEIMSVPIDYIWYEWWLSNGEWNLCVMLEDGCAVFYPFPGRLIAWNYRHFDIFWVKLTFWNTRRAIVQQNGVWRLLCANVHHFWGKWNNSLVIASLTFLSASLRSVYIFCNFNGFWSSLILYSSKFVAFNLRATFLPLHHFWSFNTRFLLSWCQTILPILWQFNAEGL